DKLLVKMWLFPALSILTVAGIAGVLVQMAFDSTARSQFWLSLLSWAVTVGLYLLTKRCSTASGDVTFRGGAQ
ncbi:MAG: permease, partial [Mycobacterium sp.]|nr:permease [Mycobacterium sp.]